MYFEKSLCLLGRFKSPHAALALPGWLMRILGPVIEITTLPMKHVRENHFLRGSLAAEFVRDDHGRLPLRRA